MLIGSCGADRDIPKPPAAAPPLSPKKKLLALMEDNQEETKSILQDLKAADPDPAVKKRLAKLEQNLDGVRRLQVFAEASENDELATQAETFLSLLKGLQESEWTAESGPKLHKSLQYRCKVCHERFKTD
jgi:hypothetical protein